jgi:hypothetical protein
MSESIGHFVPMVSVCRVHIHVTVLLVVHSTTLKSQRTGSFNLLCPSARVHGVTSQATGLLKGTLLVLNDLEYIPSTFRAFQ